MQMNSFTIIDGETASQKTSSKLGLLLTSVTGGLLVVLTVGVAPFISPALRRVCLPYVPATAKQIKNVEKALSGCRGNLIDIGSGDGRIVIAAAKLGFKADGVELNPWLVIYSKFQALKNGVRQQTNFFCSDFWKFNMSPYQNVVVFGVEEMMPELEKKLSKELSEGAAVVACRFPLLTKTAIKTFGTGIDRVWLYQH